MILIPYIKKYYKSPYSNDVVLSKIKSILEHHKKKNSWGDKNYIHGNVINDSFRLERCTGIWNRTGFCYLL